MSDTLLGDVTKNLKEILGFLSLTHTLSSLWRNKRNIFPGGTEDTVKRMQTSAAGDGGDNHRVEWRALEQDPSWKDVTVPITLTLPKARELNSLRCESKSWHDWFCYHIRTTVFFSDRNTSNKAAEESARNHW